jgi:hypothetical protein
VKIQTSLGSFLDGSLDVIADLLTESLQEIFRSGFVALASLFLIVEQNSRDSPPAPTVRNMNIDLPCTKIHTWDWVAMFPGFNTPNNDNIGNSRLSLRSKTHAETILKQSLKREFEDFFACLS